MTPAPSAKPRPRSRKRFGRFRRWRKSHAQAPVTEGTVHAGDLIAELQSDLRVEREQIFEPLLRRMRGIARHLSDGEDVPPKLIEEGLVLWETYLKELHDPHINQIRSAGPKNEASTADSTGLADLVGDVARARVRIQTMRWAWSGYRAEPAHYRTLLALALAEEAQSGLAWERFEEEYARSFLPERFRPDTVRAWTDAFAQIHKTAPVLRERVRKFRDRTSAFALRPAA
jgi:hypothetical protein